MTDREREIRELYDRYRDANPALSMELRPSVLATVPVLLDQLAAARARIAELEGERDAAVQRAERYEAALRQYADEENWSEPYHDDDDQLHLCVFDVWNGGEGREGHGYELARAALAPGGNNER